MPLFETPKPRQFKYRPRFYDPEKERWEALKQKYADERRVHDLLAGNTVEATEPAATADGRDLEYFERRVRELETEQRAAKRGLTWRDLFRRREMPKFNYQPRFATAPAAEVTATDSAENAVARLKKRSVKIKRRFDNSDPDYMKPVPATRIILYTFLVCLLLYWILF